MINKGIDKLNLSFIPTPLHRLERLSAQKDVELLIKRDDLTGSVATGGNKLRKLEYIFNDALEKGADTVITTGGPQSNHAKATAAVAAQLGLKAVLVHAGNDPGHRQANLFINELVGADIRFSGATTPETMERALLQTYESVQKEGYRPYMIPIGGSNGLGSVGYAQAYEELGNHDFDTIFVTAGSGGTFAGLYVANELRNLQAKLEGRHIKTTKLIGISPWLHKKEITKRIVDCVIQLIDVLQLEEQKAKHILDKIEDTIIIDDQFIGRGYGHPTKKSLAAIRLLAKEEAIILDHVYTGKTMAALFDYLETCIVPSTAKILFWHTGGAPALFTLQNEWGELVNGI